MASTGPARVSPRFDETTATSRPRGKLIGLREARERCLLGESTFRALLTANLGPPGFKRPNSNRWLFRLDEVDDWLESKRDEPNPSRLQDNEAKLTLEQRKTPFSAPGSQRPTIEPADSRGAQN